MPPSREEAELTYAILQKEKEEEKEDDTSSPSVFRDTRSQIVMPRAITTSVISSSRRFRAEARRIVALSVHTRTCAHA